MMFEGSVRVVSLSEQRRSLHITRTKANRKVVVERMTLPKHQMDTGIRRSPERRPINATPVCHRYPSTVRQSPTELLTVLDDTDSQPPLQSYIMSCRRNLACRYVLNRFGRLPASFSTSIFEVGYFMSSTSSS